jgi:hypothetical protein
MKETHRLGAVLLATSWALTALSAPAGATSNVSSRYDGIYSGEATPAPDMGASSCASFSIGQVVISKGFLRTPKSADQPAIRGLITEEGYVAAWMTRPGYKRLALDGRLEANVISAGYIDEAQNCFWVVHLNPVR